MKEQDVEALIVTDIHMQLKQLRIVYHWISGYLKKKNIDLYIIWVFCYLQPNTFLTTGFKSDFVNKTGHIEASIFKEYVYETSL